ncbi:MAG TPA: phosphohistidine phosphatase SixA [Candidatus Angelobacter sp.]|jgi:phosphohistidine phosphatase|nr:phosphohistidine phosphatase SixA [Candidatus Angelobacter sp.]
MTVYFLRHASAGKKMLNSQKDERRPLDEEGILQARYIGRMLASLDIQVECIISSPLKRALQTASLVANELAFENPVHTENALRPEATFDQFQEMLADYRKYESVIVVGHNPSFTEFFSKTISENSGTAQVEFKKGAVGKVEMRGRSGSLHWLVTPKIARVLQSSLKSSSRPKTSRK